MDLGVTAVMLPEIDFDEQIELCVSLGIRRYQFSCGGNHRFDLTPERLVAEGKALSLKLTRAGLVPWGTLPAVRVDDGDETIALHLRGAAEAGAGRMRLDPPLLPPAPFDCRAFIERAAARYEEVARRLAKPLGIRLLVETQAGSIASSPGLAWALVGRLDPRDIGVIFDLTSFAREGELAPDLAVSILKNAIDCVHVGGSRRVIAGSDERGCKRRESQFCSMEESDLHIPSWIAAIQAAGIAPPLIIEDFSPGMSGADKLRRGARLLHSILKDRAEQSVP
ncbi:MAG: sugar phosphate isomerase/epimerase [Acidobacteria bacterium]|nr:sugar phosphate isomerase/epimerase [Spirochaetota bacterium]MBE3135626.1 sugar phosphate isomerase/epimerase [Acidobacteriota bacterium]